MVKYKDKHRDTLPVGGENRASGCESFEKMSFSPERNYWSIPEQVTKFPKIFHWFFDQLLQFKGNLLGQTRAVFSSFHMATRFCKERPVISKRFFALEFIHCHCQTLMLRIFRILGSLGCWLWSRDYMEWPILTAATTLHRLHLCVLELSHF